MNKVFLRGNLTRDVELRTTESGKDVANFGIAVRREFKNADGEYESDFINCEAWGNLADTIAKYFHKGSGIFIIGRLQTKPYDRKDGTTAIATNVVLESIEFDRKVEKKEEETSNSEVEPRNTEDDPYAAMGQQIQIDDNELPF